MCVDQQTTCNSSLSTLFLISERISPSLYHGWLVTTIHIFFYINSQLSRRLSYLIPPLAQRWAMRTLSIPCILVSMNGYELIHQSCLSFMWAFACETPAELLYIFVIDQIWMEFPFTSPKPESFVCDMKLNESFIRRVYNMAREEGIEPL
jgi:hypothetical protein